MTKQQRLDLCRNFNNEPGTRYNVRTVLLPELEREVAELAKCRHECAADPIWAEEWRSAGMVSDELVLRSAIVAAKHRLSA